MPKKYYVVWAGRETGVFTSWADTSRQVNGFSQAKFKSFKTRREAEAAYAAGWSKSREIETKRKSNTSKKPQSTVRADSASSLEALAGSASRFDIQIFCDGACEPNPGEAGSGVAVYREGALAELWYGLYNNQGTNNSAELNAFYQALVMAREGIENGKEVAVLSDSQYSIKCITDWAFSWQKKGWKRKKPGDIKNLEIIKSAHELYLSIRKDVVVSHVSAHIGIEGNELADRMAVYGIDQKDPEFCLYRETLDVQEILAFRAG